MVHSTSFSVPFGAIDTTPSPKGYESKSKLSLNPKQLNFDAVNGLDPPIPPVLGSVSLKKTGNSEEGDSGDGKPPKKPQHINKQSWEYIVRSGVAGGIAGSCAKTLIAPLDRIKILFQTGNPHYIQFRGSMKGLANAFRHINRIDGLFGFYQGHSATLMRIFPYSAIKFITYEQLRNIIIPTKQHETHFRRLISGSCAGLCSVFVTYPLDLVRIRMAYITHRKEAKLTTVVKGIYEGNQTKSSLKNFYRGFMPTMYGMIPYAGVAFYTHDLFHDVFKSKLFADIAVDPESLIVSTSSTVANEYINKKVILKTWAELISGGLAGMLSQTAAYPFEIIRRRLQVTQNNSLNTWSMAKIILKEKGWRGFYIGLSIGYIKVTPMVACSFFVYEKMKFYFNI